MDVKVERGGKTAQLILLVSMKPARNKSNEKHCLRLVEAKQTYLRKLFKFIMTEPRSAQKRATSALGIALTST